MATELFVQTLGAGALQKGWGVSSMAVLAPATLSPVHAPCVTLGSELWFAHK